MTSQNIVQHLLYVANHRDGLLSSSIFSLILDSSVALSASIQSDGESVQGPWFDALTRGRQHVSLLVPEHRN